MRILGISAYYHDSAAALIEDGQIRCAAQEERFTRKKHDSSFPRNAISFCLEESGIHPSEIDHVAFYDKPFLKFERLLETYVAFAPQGFKSFRMALPLWLREKLFQKKLLIDELERYYPDTDWSSRLLFSEHHLSHAASAFYPSPFEKAVVLTMDGVGEWATTSVAIGNGSKLDIHKELHFPHSLGLLYSAFTYYTGFKVNSGEYKLMGLAPYGEPKFTEKILENLIDLKSDGTFRLNMQYFNYCTGLTMTNKRFDKLFGMPPRKSEDHVEQVHMDLAASIQVVTEEIVLRLTRSLAKEYGIPNLCLAGGVALNCVANGKVLRDGSYESVWIQPAAGDAGGALGAAMVAYYLHRGMPRLKGNGQDGMLGAYLGPRFTNLEVKRRLDVAGACYESLENVELIRRTARAIAEGKAVGWFQGKMEFGPRALGGRSILGDPRSPAMQKELNLKIKFRESFRPFAPSVRIEDVSNWFDLDRESPYMLVVADVKAERRRSMTEAENILTGIDKLNIPRSEIPAVTHVDYSARVQTVDNKTNPSYHALITEFKKLTGCPVLVNTSFNVRGEPIVCTPEDAFKCFMGTNLDVLVVENCYMEKPKQDKSLVVDYKDKFELD